MRRFQLIEIEDQPWCPAPVRDGATDYLQYVVGKIQPYRAITPRLAAALDHCGTTRVIDLCSGAGGPWPTLLPYVSAALAGPLEVCLTDLYPNLAAWQQVSSQLHSQIGYETQAVDARQVPAHLTGFRTLFSGFHHFNPVQAVHILRDAVEKRQGIGIFEATERRPPALLGMLLVPLLIALVTPAIRPFRWSRLLWTYLLPAIPLVGLFDGVVSCLRTYTPGELQEMAYPFSDYDWDIGKGRASRAPASITYLIGTARD